MPKLTDEQMKLVGDGHSGQEIDAAVKRIEQISYQIYMLGKAFWKTGNEHVSTELISMSDSLDDNAAVIKDQVYRWSDNDFKRSQRSSANMLNAALAIGMREVGNEEAAMEIAKEIGKDHDVGITG